MRDDGIDYAGVVRILDDAGLGLPPYTEWGRSRSGCFFCFYQQKIEWVRLKEHHPDLFEKAKAYEATYAPSGNTFTWSERESLAELERPERMAAIKAEHERRKRRAVERGADLTLAQVFAGQEIVDDEEQAACLICTL